jgi:predicted aldo/keto reductase-like oxidoreductase
VFYLIVSENAASYNLPLKSKEVLKEVNSITGSKVNIVLDKVNDEELIDSAAAALDKLGGQMVSGLVDYRVTVEGKSKEISIDKMADLGVMEWLEEQKANGIIKNIGFSFHGSKMDFESVVKAYPWDFCQIQYNYLDENNQAGVSGLKLAHSLGIPVIVMEPLRGGKLVNNLPKEVVKAFERVHPEWTPAEWGLRWIWNHKEVNVVLSGMSTQSQVNENIRIASHTAADSLTEEELKVFEEVKSILNEKIKVPCTGCGYCMPCPHGVNIPGCFSSYNDKFLLEDKMYRWKYAQTLGAFSKEPAFASKCMECGKCEPHCPQNIEIRKELKAVAKTMEGILFRPIVGAAGKILRIR